MYISKRGPQFVLVASLLVMLSPPRRAHSHPMLNENDQPPRTMTRAYLYNVRYESFVSLHRPRRRGKYRVVARSEEKNSHSLLRFETELITNDTKIFFNIYNEKAKRYICFNKRGRVRAAKRRNNKNLTCRFRERLHVRTEVFQFLADKGKGALSFNGKRRRAVLRPPTDQNGRWPNSTKFTKVPLH
ncbi:uncharacterized protein LOC119110228 [Pollicipes pollicipes]|uniref:uncharacterized protein LOC119110228 n=1 Tax=Pollicipes pollicipes TaxID=41117 RepID=UPI001884F039|nr:uncharacterized protein LOC119110228 [Pollicipes pollicipes]